MPVKTLNWTHTTHAHINKTHITHAYTHTHIKSELGDNILKPFGAFRKSDPQSTRLRIRVSVCAWAFVCIQSYYSYVTTYTLPSGCDFCVRACISMCKCEHKSLLNHPEYTRTCTTLNAWSTHSCMSSWRMYVSVYLPCVWFGVHAVGTVMIHDFKFHSQCS